MIQSNLVDLENMFDLLSLTPEVQDAPNAVALRASASPTTSGSTIEFRDVSFRYLREKAILHRVSFKVPAGGHLAIVGPSGSGKSTIVRLLFRFYDVDEGAIIVDGQDTRLLTQDSLRRVMAVVPQDTVRWKQREGRLSRVCSGPCSRMAGVPSSLGALQ
jgi:ABC-type multidrug transport system fused ATPase/permease subunit